LAYPARFERATYILKSINLDGLAILNRYQYPRHLPTLLGTAFQILLEKAHRCNYGA